MLLRRLINCNCNCNCAILAGLIREERSSISSSAAAESSEHLNNHQQLGGEGRADALEGCSSPAHVVVRRCGMRASSVVGCLHRKGSRLGTRWSLWSGPGPKAGSFRVGKHAVFKCRMGACLCCALLRARTRTWCAPIAIQTHRMPHLSMFGMLYLEKKIPQPPPESCYINRSNSHTHRVNVLKYW